MKLQILGPGCMNCQNLAANAEAAAKHLGLEYNLEKVTHPNDIAKFGIVRTPVLVVDGKIKSTGKVLTVAEVTTILATCAMEDS